MKHSTKLALGLIALSLAGCSSLEYDRRIDQAAYDKYMPECLFKDGRTEAPKWVCGYPVEGYEVSEVGYAASGIEEEAKADAVAKLANRIKVDVSNTATKKVESRGRSNSTNYSSVSIQSSKEVLRGTRVVLRITDPATLGLHVFVVGSPMDFTANLSN